MTSVTTVTLELTQGELTQLLAAMAGTGPRTRAEGIVRLTVLRKIISADTTLNDEQKRAVLDYYDSLERLLGIRREAWN